MAAYAASVTSWMREPIQIGPNLAIWMGTVDITNYNTTLAEIAGITGKFRNPLTIIVIAGTTDNGYVVTWVPASKAFKAWYPAPSHTHVLHFQTAAAANAVTAAANQLRTAAAAFDVAGVANATGEGGIVNAAAGAGTEVAADVDVGAAQFVAYGLG